MTTSREIVSLDALTFSIADALQDPTYCLSDDGDGFARFNAQVTLKLREAIIRATSSMVSDGEDEIESAAGEVFEITVRRVTPL